MLTKTLVVIAFSALSIFACPLSRSGGMLGAAEPKVLVPRNLLKLVQTPEVQEELGVNGKDNEQFMKLLAEVDGPLWRSRQLPEEKQLKVLAELEKQFLEQLKPILPNAKMKRLREIEVQSIGIRALARAEFAKDVGLNSKQSQELQSIFLETDRIARKVLKATAGDQALMQELASAKETEMNRVKELLTNPQRAAFAKSIGAPFDTMSLKRVHPLAPELIDSGAWAGSSVATTLAEQKGKVVLVHYYAFQCHNCVANFKHYNRWHETLREKGVSVIGIQSPETPDEGDASKVRQAAKDRGFEFPVLIDLKMKNWQNWGNTMWPTVYVVDKNGYLRYWWQGELNWEGATGDKTIEGIIDELLEEKS
jgi:peroxiredoxin